VFISQSVIPAESMAETDRILGYFLDEAQEHLRTIEEGLILPMSLAEPAKIKEVFRAAHSIKGGAAMLGLEVVCKIGNHFEQAFKAIKDRSIPVDEKLQDLLLEGLEILRLSIQMVQHNQLVPINLAEKAVFAKIAKRIQRSSHGAAVDDSNSLFTDPAIEQVFGNYVNQKLQQFVDVCKKSQAEFITKQELQPICQKIGSLGESFEYLAWTNLLISCRLAVNNPLNSVMQLQEVIPNAIHQAQMLVMAGKHHAITSTPELEILLTPNAINSTRTQTNLSAYDTLDSISGVWDDVVITEDEFFDSPIEKSQSTNADFLFEPQMVSTEAINSDDDNFSDSDHGLEEFMQLFDEELSFDGTWVQNEDVLAHEDTSTEQINSDSDKNLWDEDISTRPIVTNSLIPIESFDIFDGNEIIGQQLPQFDFEQVSDSELFVEDVTDTAVKPPIIKPTAVIDWSGLLADIPSEVIMEYEEPSQPPPDLPSSLKKIPIELNNDFLSELTTNMPTQLHDDISDPYDPFLNDFSDLPFGLDLENSLEEMKIPDATRLIASENFDPFLVEQLLVKESDDQIINEPFETTSSVFSPPDYPQLRPIDADYLKELAMFDDLLADTKTTDVDLADLEQMIADGNLEEELDLENIEDFSPASVNSKVNSKVLINFDDFLTEAKTTVNNTTNSNHFSDYQPISSDHSTTVMTASVSNHATFATERAATEADLGLEELDLLDLNSIENLSELNYELDDVLAGLNMLDISGTEEPSGCLINLPDQNCGFDGLDSGNLVPFTTTEPEDFFNSEIPDRSAELTDSISELFMDDLDHDYEQLGMQLSNSEANADYSNGSFDPGFNSQSSITEKQLDTSSNELVSLDYIDANLEFINLDQDNLDINSDLVGLDLGTLNSNFDDLDINSDLVSLDLGVLNSDFGNLDNLLDDLADNSLVDLDELLSEDNFDDLDAFLTVPPVDGMGIAIDLMPAVVVSQPTPELRFR
jgi:chemotaxis protein histidine kinase CheA